jgi:hypothetical protein
MLDDGIPLTREEEIEFLRSTSYDAVIILNCHGQYQSLNVVVDSPEGITPTFISMGQYGVDNFFFAGVETDDVNAYGMFFNIARSMLRKTIYAGNRKGFLEKYAKNLRRLTKMYKENMKNHDKKWAKGNADFNKYRYDSSWHIAKSGRYLEKFYTPFAPDEGTNKSVTVYLLTNPGRRDIFNLPIPNGVTRTTLLMWCEKNGIRAPLIVDAACSGFEGQQTERQTRKLRNHLKKEGIAMGGRKSRK